MYAQSLSADQVVFLFTFYVLEFSLDFKMTLYTAISMMFRTVHIILKNILKIRFYGFIVPRRLPVAVPVAPSS